VKEEGETFSIEEPLDGKASHTDVKVLQVRHGEVLPRNIWMPGDDKGLVMEPEYVRICQNMSEYARGMCKSQENVKDREGHIRPDMARTSCPSKMTSIGDKASEERFRSKTHNSKEATILRTNLETI
jgi:hypothetical protein